MDPSIHETARAKINLALHVTGRRADGYHLLDSLVTFAEAGDGLSFASSAADRLTLGGCFGALLDAEGDNLVVRARDLLRQALQALGHTAPPVHIHLEKELPIAAGIGGGSADAAATLRGLQRLWNVTLPDEALAALALRLGADVPMCLSSRPLIARGIGEALTPVVLPGFSMVLANPLIGVSTPEIFRRLERRDNAALPPLPSSGNASVWLDFLKDQRNDLEPPARSLVPIIGDLIAALEESGASLARMSGSGATCFGLYADEEDATAATEQLAARFPKAYIKATRTLPGDA